MGAASDPEVQRIANMRRRAYMLARHELERGPDGRSRLAVKAGREGGRRTVERHGPGRAWALHMNLRKHHGIPVPWRVQRKDPTRNEDA